MTEHPALTETEVLGAVDAIVDAFRRTDGAAYFACFSVDATFVFPDQDARLDSRAAYERLWAEWVASGWRVLDCTSTDAHVQVLGDAAVLSHTVRTRIATGEGEATAELHERETIVLHRQGDGRLLAVHEHLSSAPDEAA
ncbi:SgcJ/EcaC family oxidoreductase [Microcella daejeonensis]|uniref:SgcJ/EcaC family oxidoreductase n=1 Tax=Microcella daejeonensis TaxID=2994971 RepID=A0A9E8MKE5_9MICO|nr:SgcJ/EcaC family oxidoreductase [Microcella daejeonensis]WAB81195.1 SgcJ/EcaC family oxidoreductase [Microcella daejeonensis]